MISERRLRTSKRGQPIKRRSMVHDEEPDTKNMIPDTDGEDYNDGIYVDVIQARREDVKILSMAVLGKSLHDIYSNQ